MTINKGKLSLIWNCDDRSTRQGGDSGNGSGKHGEFGCRGEARREGRVKLGANVQPVPVLCQCQSSPFDESSAVSAVFTSCGRYLCQPRKMFASNEINYTLIDINGDEYNVVIKAKEKAKYDVGKLVMKRRMF